MDNQRHFQHKATLPAIIVMLVISIGLLLYGFLNFENQTTLPQGANQSAIGIRLGENESDISVKQLQNSGISFVYLDSIHGTDSFNTSYKKFRRQISKTKLAFGTIIHVDLHESPLKQVQYLYEKIGTNLGSLPIMLIFDKKKLTNADLKMLSQLINQLNANHEVMVKSSSRYAKYLPQNSKFLAVSDDVPNKLAYCFWQYTDHGHVKNVTNLTDSVTMYAYIGTSAQYKEKYGSLTQ